MTVPCGKRDRCYIHQPFLMKPQKHKEPSPYKNCKPNTQKPTCTCEKNSSLCIKGSKRVQLIAMCKALWKILAFVTTYTLKWQLATSSTKQTKQLKPTICKKEGVITMYYVRTFSIVLICNSNWKSVESVFNVFFLKTWI